MSIVVSTKVDKAAAMMVSGMSSEELDRRDAIQQPIGRWFAYATGVAVGMATAFVRPDGRLFVVPRVTSESAFRPLLERALDDVGQIVYLTANRNSPDRLDFALSLGFEVEVESLSYEVAFAAAIQRASRFPGSSRIEIVRADQVERDALMELDVDLRQDVPGTDGWDTNRVWFDSEFISPTYDPAGYLVAVEPGSGDLVGLVRFWRDEDSPTLGMIGVRRGWRSGRIAIELANAGLSAASAWGSETFTTHSAHQSIQRRIRIIGAEPSGTFVQLRSQPRAS